MARDRDAYNALRRAQYAADPSRQERARAAARAWRQANPEKARAIRKRWEVANQDKEQARKKRYHEKNRDRHYARSRAWRLANPEKAITAVKKSRAKKLLKYQEKQRLWKQSNPDKRKAQEIRRRALERGASGLVSAEQIAARVAYFGNKCSYCPDGPYEHLEHAIPLSRGGTNWPANIRPSCSKCNLRKGTRTIFEFLGLR